MAFIWRLIRENWLALLVVGGLAVAWLLLRTPATRLASVEEFEQRIRSDSPVVVEFFSNT